MKKMVCSRCKQPSHNIATCPEILKLVASEIESVELEHAAATADAGAALDAAIEDVHGEAMNLLAYDIKSVEHEAAEATSTAAHDQRLSPKPTDPRGRSRTASAASLPTPSPPGITADALTLTPVSIPSHV